MTAPLLSAREVRIDVSGAPAVEGLSLETTGDNVLVLGAPRSLFEAASGTRAIAKGELLALGRPSEDADAAGAPLDPPLPPWNATRYINWSSRLAGHSRGDARALTRQAMENMRLTDAPLAKALPHYRRGVVIAAAIATGARAIFLEDPLAELPDDVGRTFARIIAQALEDRPWAIFAGRLPLMSPLAMHADEALVIRGSRVSAQGAPAEIVAKERSFAVRVIGAHEPFVSMLSQRGGKVDARASEITVDLGELSTRDLFAIAAETSVTIVEIQPLGQALG